MSIGIGLGAFMEGFQGGLRARQTLDDQRETRRNRQRMQAIDDDATNRFAEAKATGTGEEGSYEDFWMRYALPRRTAELLRQGKVPEAAALKEWGESDAARQGGKLFSSAMLKAQTGDASGALADVIKAGQIRGYLDHGYELLGQDEIRDDKGTVLGFRLRIKGPDGKPIEQDIATGDLPRVIATFANPDAAWQSQVAARTKANERVTEMADFEEKKKIEQRYSSKATPDHEKAYMDARKARLENDLDFAGLPAEEQDRVIRSDLDAARGYAGDRSAPTSPGLKPSASPQVVVDEKTGQAVAAPAPAPVPPSGTGLKPADRVERRPLPPVQTAPPADFHTSIGDRLSAIPADKRAAMPAQRPTLASPHAARAEPSPQGGGLKRPSGARAEMLGQAATAVASGQDPVAIARRLADAGVPREEFPPQVERALQERMRIGLR